MLDGGNERDLRYMDEALQLAQLAMQRSELPCAALLVDGGHDRVLSRQHAQDRQRQNRISHAELLLLLDARMVNIPRRRLIVYTTLEPCIMCMAALCTEGVGRIVYGLASPLDGGSYLLQDAVARERWGGHVPQLLGGVRQAACAALFEQYARLPDAPRGMVGFARDLLLEVAKTGQLNRP